MLRATRLRDLPTGAAFWWRHTGQIATYRGNGWYGSANGFDGGPWHCDNESAIVLTASPDRDSAATYTDSGEGPWETMADAVAFAVAEVGVKWGVEQVGGKWRVLVMATDNGEPPGGRSPFTDSGLLV